VSDEESFTRSVGSDASHADDDLSTLLDSLSSGVAIQIRLRVPRLDGVDPDVREGFCVLDGEHFHCGLRRRVGDRGVEVPVDAGSLSARVSPSPLHVYHAMPGTDAADKLARLKEVAA
jgi:hypothetical protein